MKKEEIKSIIEGNDNKAKINLFSFDKDNDVESVYRKYVLYSRSQFPRYFQSSSAPFHKEMILNSIKSYRKDQNFLNLAFRGASKTSPLKVFVSFILLNDIDHTRKYIKILTKDLTNSVQFVTDVYNLLVEVEPIYGDVFEKEGKTKLEEQQGKFTMKSKVKITAGTVGKTQRGHAQDAYRPDWIIFDDIEDRDSISSAVITQKIIDKVDEAIQGLSVDGNYVVLGNYISDIGVIENIRKKNVVEMITPIVDKDGIPTWDRYTLDKIENIKKDAEDWYGEYLCDPISGNNREFKKDLFKYITWNELEQKDTLCYLTIDPAISKKESADYTGFTLNFVDKENKWHFKAWREKIDISELFDKIFNLYKRFNPEEIGIEEVSFTQAVKPFLDDEMRKRNIFLPIKMLKHGGDKKEMRIRGLLPRYESGSIYHIVGETSDLEAELLRFPQSKNDDTMDSAAYQSHIAEPPYNINQSDDDFSDSYQENMYNDIGL